MDAESVMRFSRITDSGGIVHIYLIIQVLHDQFRRLRAKYEKSTPFISASAVLCNGHPYVVFDFGLENARIRLDDPFGSGDKLGEKLAAGDVTTIILTDKPQDQTMDSANTFNFNLDEIIAYTFTFTTEMHELYTLYHMLKQANPETKLKTHTEARNTPAPPTSPVSPRQS